METVLITGASSGIGLELAKLFAADKSNLILVARSADKLTSLAESLRAPHGVTVRVMPKDLAQPEAPQQLFDELSRDGVEIDVLVNNAGFGHRGTISQIPLQRQLDMIQVNITALTALTRLFLPGMLARNRGGILNVGSTAGFQPGPEMGVYYATKAYVQNFTEALAEEAVARIGYDGFRKGKVVVITGLRNKLLVQSVRLSPRFMVRKITHALNK